ncbi:MAG: hypothetical protein M3Y08_12065 [Fibrobacterota bacterium]|nr:hypothetical protein [Fibrobacterota bacterium]
MSHSIAFKFLLGFVVLAQVLKAETHTNYLSTYIGSDGFLFETNHPSFALGWEKEIQENWRLKVKSDINFETYGFLVPARTPRPFNIQGAAMAGYVGELWNHELQFALGLGTIYGLRAGEVYYHHSWEGGLFGKETFEHRGISYIDASIPFQVQWSFTNNQTPNAVGFEFSGFVASEAQRWSVGLFWRHRYRKNPTPSGRSIHSPPTLDTQPQSGGEELEN